MYACHSIISIITENNWLLTKIDLAWFDTETQLTLKLLTFNIVRKYSVHFTKVDVFNFRET